MLVYPGSTADGCVINHYISTSYQLQPDKAGRRKEWGKAEGMCPCTLLLQPEKAPTPYFHQYSACTLLCYIALTTGDRTLQAIVSRFYPCATTRPPSPLIATKVILPQ